jgi:hypothetical protein
VGIGHQKRWTRQSQNQKSKAHTHQRGSVRISFKPHCKFLRRVSSKTTNLALMALISHHQELRVGTSEFQIQPV